MNSDMKSKLSRSYALHQRARELMPAGVSGQSQFRPPHPIYISRGSGSHLYDADGNEYIDFMIGAGSLMLGHGHPAINRAVREALEAAVPNLAPTERHLEFTERLHRYFPSMERIRFLPSGTEANQAAIRLARVFTGRDMIAKFEGAYHGQAENTLLSVDLGTTGRGPEDAPGAVAYHSRIPDAVRELTLIIPFNNTAAAVRLIEEHARNLAIVLAEPVLGFGGAIVPEPGFLEAIRDVTRKHGIVLSFDEVITGFRFRMGGAQHHYNVAPDLTVLGKVIAGGYPLAALGGRADLMDLFSVEEHPADYVFQSGTFSAVPVSVAAGLASLKVLEDSADYPRLNALGEQVRSGLRGAIEGAGYAVDVTGIGPLFQTHFIGEKVVTARQAADANQALLREFHSRLIEHGVFFYQGHLGFVSLAHNEQDVEKAIAAAKATLAGMRKDGL